MLFNLKVCIRIVWEEFINYRDVKIFLLLNEIEDHKKSIYYYNCKFKNL